EEQRQRFMSRLEVADKNWKFSLADIKERNRWDDYQTAYEEAIQHTATPHAPWFVVPADHKWFTRLVVAGAVIDALEELDLAYPKVDANKRAELKLVQAELENEVAGKQGKQGQEGQKGEQGTNAQQGEKGKQGKKAEQGKQGKKAKGAKKGEQARQVKGAKGGGLAADDGGSAGDGAGQRDSRTTHRAVGTEGRGATTGTV